MIRERALRSVALAVLAVGSSGPARASDDEGGATARVAAPPASGSELDPTASATRVDTDEDRPTERAIAESARRVPGAQVRALGAEASVTTVSLRGAGAEHTAVVLDDVALTTDGAVDVASFPLALFGAIEVHRGGAPLRISRGAIGGVLRLVPWTADRASVTLEAIAGSFGRVEVATRAGAQSLDGRTRAGGTVTFARADGSYPVRVDPTPLVPGDEVERARRNGEYERAGAILYGTVPVGPGALGASLLAVEHAGGVPGPALQETVATRRVGARILGLVRYDARAGSTHVRGASGVDVARERFGDLAAELTVGPTRRDEHVTRAFGQVFVETAPRAPLGLAALADASTARRTVRGLGVREPAELERLDAGAALEVRARTTAGEAPLEARLAGRLAVDVAAEARLVPTARLSATIRATRALSFAASAATGVRVPSLVELHGDGALAGASPELRPETSYALDTSAILQGRTRALRGRAELRAFMLFASDLIRYRLTAQYRAVAENVARARSAGVELGARGDLGPVSLEVAGTLLDARDLGTERPLPLRPAAQGYARVGVGARALGPFALLAGELDVLAVGPVPIDPTGLVSFDARAHVGAAARARLREPDLTLEVALRDLLDVRGSDVLGFPLPGRSVMVGLRFTEAIGQAAPSGDRPIGL